MATNTKSGRSLLQTVCLPINLPIPFFCFLLFPISGSPQSVLHPFPQHVDYGSGVLIPDHVSRRELDDSVLSFYAGWKKRYLEKGCRPGEYFIRFEEPGRKKCVSEGQGYGMLITALMAGSDSSAKTIYDGLFRYYRSHPSRGDPALMAWAQKKDCRDVDSTSATDGDMDIAYSLLLADAQWGSQGTIDYLEEARRMIAAILRHEINGKTRCALLSNAVDTDSRDYADTRASDFMPAHLRVFRKVSGDPAWDTVIDNNYRLFRFMQEKYSPDAGLVPDFICHVSLDSPIRAAPARPHFLESRYDGCYYYNACRVPWRIALDFIVNRDPRAAMTVERINRWLRSTTEGNPDNISAGYSLAGNDLPHHYFEALSFIAPFAVSAMVGSGPDSQRWLNHLWDYLIHFRLGAFDYYDNSIKMIDLIILSGNYWAPDPIHP